MVSLNSQHTELFGTRTTLARRKPKLITASEMLEYNDAKRRLMLYINNACSTASGVGIKLNVKITYPHYEVEPGSVLKESAQEESVRKMNSGEIPHDRWNCPGCPNHD